MNDKKVKRIAYTYEVLVHGVTKTAPSYLNVKFNSVLRKDYLPDIKIIGVPVRYKSQEKT